MSKIKRKHRLRRLAAAGLALTTMLSLGVGVSQSRIMSDIGIFASAASLDDISFEHDAELGCLKITGTGKMQDYCEEQPAPWSGVAACTSRVVIADGISYIGRNAFAGFNTLTDVELPDSITAIDNNSFDKDAQLTFHASEQSTAAKFAEKNGIRLVTEEAVSSSDADRLTDEIITPADDSQAIGLTISQEAYNKLRLEWNAVPDAVGYVIYCAASVDGKYSTVATLKNVTSYVHSSRVLDRVYYYKIKSITLVNGVKTYSELSQPVSGFTHVDPPQPAENVQIGDIAYNKLRLSWDASDYADGYCIYCSNTENGKFALIKTISKPDVVTYVHGSRKLDYTYYYKVIPYKSAGYKKIFAEENQIFAAATHVDPPAKVENVSMSCPAFNKLTVSWEPVSDAYGYMIYCSETADGVYKKAVNITGSKTSFTHSNRHLGQTYFYKVASYKKAGSYSIFAENSDIISMASYLTAPSGLTLSANSNGTVKISYKTSAGAQGYYIYRAEDGGEYSPLKKLTASNFIDSTTVPGKTYSYKVKAIRGEFESDCSDERLIKAALSPATLTSAVSKTCTSVELGWNKVAGASGYNIYLSTSADGEYTNALSVNAVNTSCIVKGLDTNVTYYFKAEAYKIVNGIQGNADFGNIRSAKPVLTTPKKLTLSTVGKTNIFAQWNGVADADGYDVFLGKTTTGMELASEAQNNFCSLRELETNSTYYCKVRAYRKVNDIKLYSNYSDLASVTVTSKLTQQAYSWPFACYTVNNHQTPSKVASVSEKARNINMIIGGDTTKKVIYLTMDCGYPSENTNINLDTLKEKNVKVTFFVAYPFAKDSKPQIQRMIDEGHIVGNHTKNHINLQSLSKAEITTQVKAIEDFVYDNFNYKTRYFRYPYGSFSQASQQVLMDMGYTSVGWTFAYKDYSNAQPSKKYALNLSTKNIFPGAVFLLHNDSTTNTAMLGDFIDYARSLGYEFGSLDDIEMY